MSHCRSLYLHLGSFAASVHVHQHSQWERDFRAYSGPHVAFPHRDASLLEVRRPRTTWTGLNPPASRRARLYSSGHLLRVRWKAEFRGVVVVWVRRFDRWLDLVSDMQNTHPEPPVTSPSKHGPHGTHATPSLKSRVRDTVDISTLSRERRPLPPANSPNYGLSRCEVQEVFIYYGCQLLPSACLILQQCPLLSMQMKPDTSPPASK